MPEEERVLALARMLSEIVSEARQREERWSTAVLIERLELYRRYLEANGRAAASAGASASPLSFTEFVADEALLARTAEALGERTTTDGGRSGDGSSRDR